MNKILTKKTLHNNRMKSAAVENIIIWMLIFSMFVSIFFFIINYASIIRTKDIVDALADYGSNYIATKGVGDDISKTMNSIASVSFKKINADTSVICNPPDANHKYQIIFNVTTTNDSFYFYNEKISSKRVVFNQLGSESITCNLSVTIEN